jgi:hypothetical protein
MRMFVTGFYPRGDGSFSLEFSEGRMEKVYQYDLKDTNVADDKTD